MMRDKLCVVHSIDGVKRVKNDVVVTNNVSPRQAPNQNQSLSLLSLIDKHLRSMETSSAISIGTCLKEHQKIYKEWFNIADSDGDGRVSGNDATKFFAMSKLSRQELKQVWAVADSKRQGFLGLTEFITAMKLVTLAQEGHEITSDLLKGSVDLMSVELPVLEGLENVKQKASKAYADDEDNVVTQPQVVKEKAPWFKSKAIIKVNVVTIVDGLKRLYAEKLKPLEVTYRFNDFASPVLTNSDFDAKPMVMLLGQYSTGKTTFIKHLLGCEYPVTISDLTTVRLLSGAHIGPEPTTDRFVVAMSGPDERTIPGNTMAVQADMPFNGLTSFGGAFLSKFECSQMPHPVTLGPDHSCRHSREFFQERNKGCKEAMTSHGVISWFASKCDMILLLFDPQSSTSAMNSSVSFNDKPINEAVVGPIGKELFEKEQNDLITDLMTIPKKHATERLMICEESSSCEDQCLHNESSEEEMPAMMEKSKAQQRLMDNLQQEFEKVQQEYHLPAGDFQRSIGGYNLTSLRKLKPKMIQAVDDMLGYDIPDLLKKFRNPYE
ncbi:hypothetical protein HID58_092561 [Brassica napus]|uniref:Uncharacterized protein n=1 Tax=Brassica napus TaxID=3708 RepID=A0ABQ7WYC0_BRANA|nr:hypothetical protein HID58_092561 [Brassica napus]